MYYIMRRRDAYATPREGGTPTPHQLIIMSFYSPSLKKFEPLPQPVKINDWRGGLLIRSTNWLGDALMTLPAVGQIRKLVPQNVPITMLTPKNLAPMWQACPFVADVIPMAGKHISDDEITAVKSRDFGAAVVFPNSFGSAMDVWKTAIPIRIGRKGRFRGLLLTHRLREWPRGENVGVCHQLSYYLELASMLGAVEWTAECEPLKVDLSLAEALGMDDGRWLVLAPGAAYGPAKQWPPSYFDAVAKHFSEKGWRIAVVGGPNDRAAAEQSCASVPNALNVAGKTNLAQLMAVLAKATVVISNDSGPMHLAAALGKTGVALFGSTDPIGTGPIGGHWIIMAADAPCRPCFKRECPLGGAEAYKCLRSLSVESVINAVETLG